MMLRSLLFVPGDSDRKLAKAAAAGADALILDLEDSVAAARKPLARGMVREYLGGASGGEIELWVRVNPVDTPDALEDLAAVMVARPDGIVLPKARSPRDTTLLGHYLEALEVEHGIARGATRVLPVATETAGAVFTLGEYQDAKTRLQGLTWGAEDLSAAVGASTNVDAAGNWTAPYELARALCLFGAHAAGVQALDTVYTNFRDPAGLRRVCETGRRDGFTGKLAIHPDQVAVIHEVFTPSTDEIAYARRVVAAFAAQPDAGVLSLDGEMLDQPHLKQARRILELAGRRGA